jgi:hypothetical protein
VGTADPLVARPFQADVRCLENIAVGQSTMQRHLSVSLKAYSNERQKDLVSL